MLNKMKFDVYKKGEPNPVGFLTWVEDCCPTTRQLELKAVHMLMSIHATPGTYVIYSKANNWYASRRVVFKYHSYGEVEVMPGVYQEYGIPTLEDILGKDVLNN